MITISQFVQALKILFPSVTFYNGAKDAKVKQSVSVYARGESAPFKAIGGADNTSFATLPVTLLIRWGENSALCDDKANSIYEALFDAEPMSINGKRVVMMNLLDGSPVDVGRDESNVCERVIRMNIVYERG